MTNHNRNHNQGNHPMRSLAILAALAFPAEAQRTPEAFTAPSPTDLDCPITGCPQLRRVTIVHSPGIASGLNSERPMSKRAASSTPSVTAGCGWTQRSTASSVPP